MKKSAILGILALLFGFGTSAAPAPSPQDPDLPSMVAGLHSALTDSKGCYILCEFVDRETGSILAGDILVGHGRKLGATGFERASRWMTVRYLAEAPLALEVKRPGLHVLEFISPNHARVQAVFKVDRVARRVWTARVKVWRGGGVRLKVLDPEGRPVRGASASLVPGDLSARIKSLMKEAEKIVNPGLPRRPEGFLIAVPSFVESMQFGSNLPSVSDAEGNLLLQGHFEGEYRFTVRAPGFTAVDTEKIQVREGSIVTSEVRLGRAYPVVVQAVSAGGKGVEGLVVDFDKNERQQRLTDADGLCRGALPAGDAVIEVRGFGYRFQELEVKVRPGENRVRVVMKPR